MSSAPGRFQLYGLVAFALLCVSASAIFIRFADAPALTVAFWRNAIALALFLPMALFRKRAKGTAPLTSRTRAKALAAGVFLAAHFAFWISSLEYTSVSESVVLVCTQPIFVALLALVFLKEALPFSRAIGIALAFFGTLYIAFYSPQSAHYSEAAFGNLLALLGAITVAVYVLIGRDERQKSTPLILYVTHVYASAAFTLLCLCLLTSSPLFGLSEKSWIFIFMIALFPQIIGHTLFNWALKYLPAAVLSSTILVEPVVSTLLAVLFLKEVPTLSTLVGSAIILVGLALVVTTKSTQKPSS